jgi:hypothetical protein
LNTEAAVALGHLIQGAGKSKPESAAEKHDKKRSEDGAVPGRWIGLVAVAMGHWFEAMEKDDLSPADKL